MTVELERRRHSVATSVDSWEWPIRFAMLLWPIPFGLSRVLGLPALAFAAPILATAIYTLVIVGSTRSAQGSRPPALRVLLFLSCYGGFVLAMARTQMAGITAERIISLTGNILAPMLLFVAVGLSKSRVRSFSLFGYFLWSIPVYLAVDLALSGGTIASNLTQIGRLAETAFMAGANTIGVIAGLCVLLSIHNYTVRNGRLLAVAMLVASSIVLVLCDSRAAIVATGLISLMLIFSSTAWIGWLAQTSLLFSVLSAPILLGLFGLLRDSEISEMLTRSGALGTRLGLGTGRTVLWEAVLQSLGRLFPEPFIGFGYGSAARAGADAAFNYIFYSESAGLRRPLSPTLHNMSLQTIFDVGYVGLALYVTLLFVVVRAVHKDMEHPHRRIILAVISYLMLCGYTESVGTIYHFEVFIFMMGMSALALMQTTYLRGGRKAWDARG